MTPVSAVPAVHRTPKARFRAGGVVVMAALLGACEGAGSSRFGLRSPTAP